MQVREPRAAGPWGRTVPAAFPEGVTGALAFALHRGEGRERQGRACLESQGQVGMKQA